MEKLATVQMYEKDDVLKMCKTKKEENNTAEQIVRKISDVKLDDDEQSQIVKLLEYEYKNKMATMLQTKSSVTEIKEISKKEPAPNAEKMQNGTGTECRPKFLQADEEVKITNAQKGTLVHLCMQKLDLSRKSYTYDDVKQLVAGLEAKKIITPKEAEAININKVYKFTKSKIWNEMTNAKQVEREKPFYINIPAKEVYQQDLEEQLLVQGIIDLYYISAENELVLVDFKTDFVEKNDENLLVNKYKSQLDLYKRALESALNRKGNKIYIYSTYLEKEIEI